MKLARIRTFALNRLLNAITNNQRATLAVVYLILAVTSLPGADGAGVILSGNYEYTVYAGSPTPLHSAKYSFEVSVDGRLWIIEYKDTSALTNMDAFTSAVASCDGTNIYVVQYQKESAVRKAWGDRYDSVKDELPVAMATIYPGDYPPPREFALQNIWLAFASSSLLADARGKAKPPFIADLATCYDNNYNCDVYWITNETHLGSRELILMADGRIPQEVRINDRVQDVKLPAPYDKGYTNSVGLWRQLTNIAGVFVPTEFEFSAFAPKPRGRVAEDLMTAYTYRCVVTNIATAPLPSVPTPLPSGRVLVTDRRFAKSEDSRTTYLATRGWFRQEIDRAKLAANQGIKLHAGDSTPDFICKTFDGKLLRLSDLRGKYVLLDFWATSCAPCVAQLPDLKATYDVFGKDKRFVLVSLSLDTTEAEPRKFVTAKGIRWTQSFLDDQLKSSVERAYGFSAVPQVLLVGPDGKLIAKDLRGPHIQEVVAAALGAK